MQTHLLQVVRNTDAQWTVQVVNPDLTPYDLSAATFECRVKRMTGHGQGIGDNPRDMHNRTMQIDAALTDAGIVLSLSKAQADRQQGRFEYDLCITINNKTTCIVRGTIEII